MSAGITTRDELQGVQILRAIAALAVVTHHTIEVSNGAIGRFSPDWLTTAGAGGVDIFFVISGFIMPYVSFRPRARAIAPGAFLFRRFTRIFPLYWACCLAMLIVHALGLLHSTPLSGADVALSALLVPAPVSILGVAWTLSYEMYFYLIFSLTMMFRSKAASVVGSTFVIVAMMIGARFVGDGSLRTFLGNPIALEFCLGLGLNWLHSHRAGEGKARLALAAASFVLMIAAPVFIPHPTTAGLPGIGRVLAGGLPGALAVFALLGVKGAKVGMASLAVRLGDASYALYLTHEFVTIGYARLLKIGAVSALAQGVVAPLVIALSIALALLAHHWLERPLLALARALGDPRDRARAHLTAGRGSKSDSA